jgi:hypothetical protein
MILAPLIGLKVLVEFYASGGTGGLTLAATAG